jgi:hypothetical protein
MAERYSASEMSDKSDTHRELCCGEAVLTAPTVDLESSIGQLIFGDVQKAFRDARHRGRGVVYGRFGTMHGKGPQFYLVQHAPGYAGAYLRDELHDPPIPDPSAPQDVVIAVGVAMLVD